VVRTWLALAALLIATPTAAKPRDWTSLGPEGGRMSAIAFDPSEPQAAYAIGHYAGFRRDHASAPWRRVIDDVYSLAVDADGTVYFGGYGRVFRSRDRGAAFTSRPIPVDGSVEILSLDARDGSLLAVSTAADVDSGGIAAATLLRSSDDATTWRVVRVLPHERIAGVTRDPDHPDTIYVGAELSGVLVSRDDGASWETAALPCTGAPQYTRCVESILAVPGALLVGTFNLGVVRSRDGGTTWEVVTEPAFIAALSVTPQAPDVLYAGGAGSWPGAPGTSSDAVVLRSTDAGASWQSATAVPPPAPIIALAVGSDDPNRLLAGTGSREFFAGDGVYVSADGGAIWQRDNAGLDAACVSDLAAGPAESTVVYAALRESTFAVSASADGGTSWRAATPALAWPYVPALAIDPRDPQVAYAAAHIDGLFVTRDGGSSWSHRPLDLGALSDVAIDAEDGALYTIGPSGWLSKSTDGGATYTALLRGDSAAIQVEVDPRGGGVYGLSYGALHVSRDRGLSWELLLEPRDSSLWRMAVATTSPPTLYVASRDGARVSRDGGQHWDVLHITGTRDAVQLWAIDPSDPRTVYAAGFGGAAQIYRSDNAGRAWRRIGTTSPFPIGALAVDPIDPRVLYVGTCGAGVQRLTQPAASAASGSSGSCAVTPPAIDAPLLLLHALLIALFARSVRRR
jgi:photosystem II stability/assembly factor-like uncharacterized protein